MPGRIDGKKCSKCGEFKPPDGFYVHGRTTLGKIKLSPKCKVCHSRIVADRSIRNGRAKETLEQRKARTSKRRMVREWTQIQTLPGTTDWERLCRAKAKQLGRVTDEWTIRIRNAIQSMRTRNPNPAATQHSPARNYQRNWEIVMSTAMRELHSPELTEWDRRIRNAQCLLKTRTRNKQRAKTNSGCC